MRILFVPVPSGKPWTGSTVATDALGGSEASVAYTAKALAKNPDLQVHVVSHGTPDGKQSTFNDVTYHGINDLNLLIGWAWDVVVISRWDEALTMPWKTSRKIFWIHDLRTKDDHIQAHHVVAVSHFQRNQWNLDEDVCTVIGNGVEMNGGSKELSDRNPNKLLWTSNPDRGLWLAAKIFQDIRKRWPDLELHAYGRAAVYGWDDNVEEPFMPLKEHSENVFIHDPLPRYLLFRELSTSWCFFYPTFWPETYCMAALEAQSVGTPVVASPFAALNETVKGGILQHDYLNSISQLRNVRRWNKLSKAGVEWAEQNTWDEQAKRWMEVFNV